jgi:hypothetical protein
MIFAMFLSRKLRQLEPNWLPKSEGGFDGVRKKEDKIAAGLAGHLGSLNAHLDTGGQWPF